MEPKYRTAVKERKQNPMVLFRPKSNQVKCYRMHRTCHNLDGMRQVSGPHIKSYLWGEIQKQTAIDQVLDETSNFKYGLGKNTWTWNINTKSPEMLEAMRTHKTKSLVTYHCLMHHSFENDI